MDFSRIGKMEYEVNSGELGVGGYVEALLGYDGKIVDFLN
jgi:hypothetical protein